MFNIVICSCDSIPDEAFYEVSVLILSIKKMFYNMSFLFDINSIIFFARIPRVEK